MRKNKLSLISSLLQEKPWYQSEKKSITSTLLIISADIFQYLPSNIKQSFFRAIDEVGLFFIRFLKILPLKSQEYHFITIEQNNQKSTILYQGDLSTFTQFLNSICPDKNNRTVQTFSKEKSDNKTIKEIKNQVDAIILEKDYFFRGFYQKRNYIVIPENISYILSTQKPINAILQTFSKDIQKDIKKAESIGYQHHISNKMKDFTLFYNTMYLPYITWKYEDVKKIISYHAMKHYFLRGANILCLTLNNTSIFGGIFEVQNQKIITHYAGIKQGKYDHIQNGIIALSYYCLIKIAKEKNILSINFGTSPPFINDGLCKYKMKWNVQIVKTKPIFSTIFAININDKSRNFSYLFKNNPFFYYKNNTLSVAYYLDKFEDTNIKRKEILKQNRLKGMEPTFFHNLTEL